MKNRKYIFIIFLIVIRTCRGLLEKSSSNHLTSHQDAPQETLHTQGEKSPALDHLKSFRSQQEPSQKLVDARERKGAPPLMYVNGHSDIHKTFQTKKNSLLETETSRYVKLYDELTAKDGDRGIGDGVLEEVFPKSLWFALHTQMINDDPDNFQRSSDVWDGIQNGIGGFYLPSTNLTIVNNTQCIKDVETFNGSLSRNVSLMVDSWGKLPDGFLGGNTVVMGSFDECVKAEVHYEADVRRVSESSFQGKYCLIAFSNSNVTVEDLKMPNMVPISGIVGIGSPYIWYATCMPSTCTDDDLRVSLNEELQKGLKTNLMSTVSCQTREKPSLEYTAGAIVMIIILALEGSVLLVAAVIDIWIQYSGKEDLRKGILKYLLVFSFYTNLSKMFHVNTSENKEAITCLYGMRVLSMIWVIWGHQYVMTAFTLSNKFMLSDKFNGNWLIQVVLNAYPSVDSFFFMSGLLVAYGIFREQERTGRFNIGLYYIHRIIRLLPPILLTCGFMSTFPKLMAHGPWASYIDAENSLMDYCRRFWWKDALFISNFFTESDTPYSCLGVCWYTSADFQMYVVTPLFLLPFIYKQLFSCNQLTHSNTGMIWLGIVTMISVIIPGIITGVNQLPPTFIMEEVDAATKLKQYSLVYFKPWCRASPYLVGIWLGYILKLNSKKKIHLQVWQVMAGWIIATATGLAVVFGMYNYEQFVSYPYEYNWAVSIFYGSLNHLAWGLALAWLVFACHNGYGGVVNTVLSHPSWQPLSRLTYCMFLIAYPVQEIIFIYNATVPTYLSHLNKIIETVGILFITGLGAVVLSLFTEGPILGLEKLLLRKK